MEDELGPDPRDSWVNSTEVTQVSFSGKISFSCCGLNQQVTGDNRSVLSCIRCHTVYGIELKPRLLAPEDYAFPVGTPLRVKRTFEVMAGSTSVQLNPGTVYTATQDVHGALNIPPAHQPVIVSVRGDRGMRDLVAAVPVEVLEQVGP
jgi:hypothetical protein